MSTAILNPRRPATARPSFGFEPTATLATTASSATTALSATTGVAAVAAPGARRSGTRPSGTHPSGKLRLTRRGRIVITTLVALPLVIALLVVGLSAGGAVASSTPSDASFHYVTVESGDTLWQLAVSLDPTADPRDVIAEIRDLNQLQGSGLEAGQRLAIPLRFDAPTR
ncbi:LysM repeat protein [Mycetocola sp. BIGb0189]|uniref:LysM peptidoglycan-binding domain-containing protein n=1 Tax=Mycetocola sp. BIGb0189 TaxID=2940604 RepID=UPI0021689790|nr:LysM peptidoglycan-binding domain-containing protein [Mycetocola sp. BIGb0189]MCS4275096.1 LysM repeat protein [Mycetocola sp. BIGb0189]